jgi:hypothetical protein
MLIRIHVNCGPFEGVEDFQEAFAAGGQVWIDEMASGKLTP